MLQGAARDLWRRRSRDVALAEMVDMAHRITDRRIGIGPGETQFEYGKGNAVDHNRLQIGTPDSRMPQVLSNLEGFDVKAIIKAGHESSPAAWGDRTIICQNQV